MMPESPPAFIAPALPDEALAGLRGGFSVAGGPDVALAVTTQTALDGRLILRSVFTIADGGPSLAVQAPAPGAPIAVAPGSLGGQAVTAGSAPNMTVRFDRQTGVQITPASPFASAPVNVASGALPAASAGSDAPTLDLSAGPVVTDGGTVTLVQGAAGPRVQLDGDRLAVSHLFGGAVGSVIANGGNDRLIESATTVTVSLAGATPYNLGSASLRVEGIALDVTRALVVR